MAGEITTSMLDELGIRLEDADEVNFTQVFKLEALNKAQLQLTQMLHNAYLTELEVEQSAIDWSGIATSGYATSGLTYAPVMRGSQGILKVSVQIGGSGSYIYATRLDLQKIKRVENTYLVGSNDNPLYYVFSNVIYVSVTSPYTLLKGRVLYLRLPTTMTISFDPVLNSSLHPLIVSLAEGTAWAMDNKLDRRNAALTTAFNEIKMLNEKYTPVEGIGTKGRNI